MNQEERIKVLRDWAAGKHRPPAPQNGNGAVKHLMPTETIYKPCDGIECHCPCDFRQLTGRTRKRGGSGDRHPV